jgi:hypothetical protein
LASTAFVIFGKKAMGEHMLFHNQHIRKMQDIPVEPAGHVQYFPCSQVDLGSPDNSTNKLRL